MEEQVSRKSKVKPETEHLVGKGVKGFDKRYTPEANQLFAHLAVYLPDAELAAIFGTTQGAVRKKRFTMGLKKSQLKEYKEAPPLILLLPADDYDDFVAKALSAGFRRGVES